MKAKTLCCLEKDVGIKVWQFLDIAKLLEFSTDGVADSLHDKNDYHDMLVYAVGNVSKAKVYNKYGSKHNIDLETELSDVLMILLNLIRLHGFNINDVLRLGLARYKEKIWRFKKVIK